MKAKKIFAVLCACAIAMFAFTGCSGNDTETTENTTEITSTEASTTDKLKTKQQRIFPKATLTPLLSQVHILPKPLPTQKVLK